jgi:hypothetical protein
MAVVTKQDVYNKVLEQEKPTCPHCGHIMTIWECPPVNFSDGLGWGTPYLYVCFNDECPLYLNGWKNIMDNYATHASYRCICDPTSESLTMDCMPVFSSEGGRASIVDEEVELAQQARLETRDRQIERLDRLFDREDVHGILDVLLADDGLPEVLCKAAELIGQIGQLDVIEPIRANEFHDDDVLRKIEVAIETIHERNYTKECRYCAEIIKSRALVCKHCGKDLS